MTGRYDMQDLLNLISDESAERLVLRVGKPPVVYLHCDENVVEGPQVTKQNAAELFQTLATLEQVRELEICGDIQFIYTSPKATKFGVTAKVEHEVISLEIRNLAAPAAS
jgi:Tfp pilus assembly ATPase PilU